MCIPPTPKPVHHHAAHICLHGQHMCLQTLLRWFWPITHTYPCSKCEQMRTPAATAALHEVPPSRSNKYTGSSNVEPGLE